MDRETVADLQVAIGVTVHGIVGEVAIRSGLVLDHDGSIVAPVGGGHGVVAIGQMLQVERVIQ